MKTIRTFRYFHGLYIFTICPWFCLKERIYYLIQCWIFPSVTIIGTKIIIFSNLMVIVQWRSVKYWSKNWQTQKLLSSSSTTIFLRIAAKKQNVTEGTFLSQRGLFMIFVMERTFLSWKGQYCFVGEIAVKRLVVSCWRKGMCSTTISFLFLAMRLETTTGFFSVFTQRFSMSWYCTW